MKAGRELLASAPGNPEHYEFYSELCFQLGEPNEGLDVLRRAVRINPADSKPLTTLAETLAGQFRTDEAIELYWRVFEKAKDLEGKLSAVSRLTELYIQQNQFDRLVSRLERQFGENEARREGAMCLAQAFAASGDYGAARRTLEQLLAGNTRDPQILEQLANLSEAEADFTAAAQYQKQLTEVSPSDESLVKLAQLYVRAGEYGQAEEVWRRQTVEDKDEGRILEAIDHLLSNRKPEPVLAITDKLIRKQPKDWEALYREGVALAELDRSDEAARRFRAILEIKANDDDPGAVVASRKRSNKGRPAGIRTASGMKQRKFELQDRLNSVFQIRMSAHLDANNYFGGNNRQWAPDDFGQGRMAAVCWLYSLARKTGDQDDFSKKLKETRDKNAKDSRVLWDWFYFQLVREGTIEVYEAAKALADASPTDPAAQWVYLHYVSQRVENQQNQNTGGDDSKKDKTPPLAPPELEQLLAGFQLLERRKPEWIESTILVNVAAELKRSKRTEQSDAFYKQSIESANQLDDVANAMTLAADRGDVDVLLKLYDKYERLQGNRPVTYNVFGGQGASPLLAVLKAMEKRTEDKAYADVLRILDRLLAAAKRTHETTGNRSRSRGYGSPWGAGMANYPVYLRGGALNYQALDYPPPNSYYDYGAVAVLRNAHEFFSRGDVGSDLENHLKTKLERANNDLDKIYANLALSYLKWWNDDKESSQSYLAAAAVLAPTDPDLKLEVAQLHEKLGENDDALAVADSIDPLDVETLQKRELLALRLAVTVGGVDRARTAAERLFGLRLDTNMQIQLAGQMHQLGMHELGETLLSRARRRAGNRLDTLTTLMYQYQQQGKNDVAIQVAHQILRRSVGQSPNPNVYDPNQNARQSAVQVLSRSGKIKEMIERVEKQLEKAPNSSQLLQELVDYYNAAGEVKKSRETLERIVKIHPDDSKLQVKIADRMSQDGDYASAVEHYTFAIKKEPELLQQHLWQVMQAFQQCKKTEDLVKLIEQADLGSRVNPYVVGQMVQMLMNDAQTRDAGLDLFRKLWKKRPESRQYLMMYMNNDTVWRMPEMLDFGLDAVPPASDASKTARWHSLDQITMYQNDGKMANLTTQILETAAAQNRLGEIKARVDKALAEHPWWDAGKAVKALAQCKLGEVEEGKKALEELLKRDSKDRPPALACVLIAQEIDDVDETQPLALAYYQAALEEESDNINPQYAYSPAKRFVLLTKKIGDKERARKELLRFKKPNVGNYDPSYASFIKINNLSSIALELKKLGFPVDAVRTYNEMLSELDGFPSDMNYGISKEQFQLQAQTGMTSILDSLEGETYVQAVRELLRPVEKEKETSGTAGAGKAAKPEDPTKPLLDLAVFVHPQDLEHAEVVSVMSVALSAAANDKKELPKELKEELKKLDQQRPDDLSVRITLAIAAFAEENQEAVAAELAKLTKVVDAAPIEPLPEGVKANARQRAMAARQLPLWIVARSCWKNDSNRSVGDFLAERALEAAKRQTDNHWSLAMLREWGQAALARGDKTTAEKCFSKMLDLILPAQTARKAKNPGAAAPEEKAVPASPDAAAPAAAKPIDKPEKNDEPPKPSDADPKHMSSKGVRRLMLRASAHDAPPRTILVKQAQVVVTKVQTKGQTTSAVRLTPASPAAGTITLQAAGRQSRYNTPATPYEKYMQAAQFAKFAIENDLVDLSLRTVKETLKGGPPTVVNNMANMNMSMPMMAQPNFNQGQVDMVGTQVEDLLIRLDAFWKKSKTDPEKVYEALREAVLPEGRPAEVFPYSRPLSMSVLDRPRGVGVMLVEWAKKTGKLEDLKQRVLQRRKETLAELPALALLFHVDRA